MRRTLRNLIISLSLFSLLLSVVPVNAQTRATNAAPDYLNPRLPVARRVDDLVSRMTLEEKVAQMMNKAPAIERLNVPAYDWWNEALHGVAYAGRATVFPQSIGLAASWDAAQMRRVATAISDEARAKYNDAIRRGDHRRFYGLTFWSPNINIFRDPRWGRGQETYGEDPFLTAQLGVEFVRGMQGDDPKYLKTISTPKHYAVHSGPEPTRHVFNAAASERDMRETYLPAFRAAVVEGGAGSVMCAYNRVNGEPACASRKLLGEILRGEWKFSGYVVSDCDAVADIYKHHKFTKTEEEGVALAVKRGTDVTCGYEYRALVPAVEHGLITEAEIDTAVKRLFNARFRLGLFDPPELVPYSRIPFDVNDSPAHRELARAAARESMVLLKNEGNLLPLRKDLKSIAVIGPNADSLEVLLGNYHGIPSKWVTPVAGIRQKVSPATRVTYALGTTLTGEALLPVPASALSQEDGTPGLRAEYFANRELQGEPAVRRTDPDLNFDWFTDPPAPQLPMDNFSARWTGRITAPASGTYQLGARADDAVRVYIDDQLFIDSWRDGSLRTTVKPFEMEAGRSYKLRVEFYDRYADATAKLVWGPPHLAETMFEDALKAAKESDVVVMALGLDPSIEGEERDVKLEGFSGGDRTSLDLPKVQEDLLKAVHATGKPVVLVLFSGGGIGDTWADANVPAIVQAWYPGEEGGAALADVLFGDYNPAGRLPVTFYKSAEQLPPFDSYGMEGRTYRYFRGEPLYPFGHGLSYTRFEYRDLKVKKSVKAGESVWVSAEVRNAGTVEGDEVVQLYLTGAAASINTPARALKGFERVRLRPGESRRVSFTLAPGDMALIDEAGRRMLEPGEFRITVGGKQPGFKGNADARTTGMLSGSFNVTGKRVEIP
ncbi:MAG TPA: glycoside hydrolase family 3 C-terminal domain-containing protein [Pyrinomonadaceae bacterium]|nr:glycoside hydrolase family 3 C-terminal domain-containing protein [Pyrinomonadaceae bacterium]